MRSTGSRLAGLIAALAVLLSSCGGGTTTPEADIDPQDPQLVSAGAELYAASCAQCHGDDLRGTDSGPSHLSEVYVPSHHSDGAFLVAVRAGSPQHHWDFGPMEPVAGLSDADVEAIVAFVRDRQRTEGFEPYPP